jgi:ribonuclease J
VLRERRTLARAGVLTVTLVADRSGNQATTPLLHARGVIQGESEPSGLRFVALAIAKAVESATSRDDAALGEAARLAARRAIEAKTGRKPVCLVTVTRTGDLR